MQSDQQLLDRCREAGMRITPQRRAIFRCLAGNRTHPTAEDVFHAVRREHPGVSLATVYNTLDALHRLDEVARLRVGGAADRFDPEVRPHHHFACDRCGAVQDVFAELPLPRLRGGRVTRMQVQLFGLCESCSRQPRRSTP